MQHFRATSFRPLYKILPDTMTKPCKRACWWVVLFLGCSLGYAQPMAMTQADLDSITYATSLENVVITAQYAPTDSRNSLHEIRTIDRATIERRGATNLEQLLNQEINIRISQDLVLGSSISMLGIDGQNVKIMIDGVPVIGRQDGNINLSQINLNGIERVEIVEGPLAVSYGTDALAGVINLITRKAQANRYELGFSAQVEDRGENSYVAQVGTRLGEKLTLRLNGGYDHFDGFSEDTLRSVLWNPKEQIFLDADARYQLNDQQSLRYRFSIFDEEVTNLGNVRRPRFKPYAFDDVYQTQRINHTLMQEGKLWDNYYLQTTLGFNQFRRHKNSYRTNFEDDSQELVLGQQDTSIFNGAMLRATLASQNTEGPLNFQLGIDWRYDNAVGARIEDPVSDRDNFSQMADLAVFGTFRYQPFQRLLLETGLRYAYNTRYQAPLVPSFHLKYDLAKDWVVRASYGQGFRNPDLKELFFNFIDINHYIVGNSNLQAEKSDNVQLSLTYEKATAHGQRFTAKFQGFYNHIRDKIELFEYIETPEGFIPAIDTSTLRYTYFNQATYKTQGGNLRLSYHSPHWQVQAGGSVIGYYNPSSETLAGVDPFTYTFEMNQEVSYLLPKQGFSFSVFGRWNDRLVSFFPEVNDEGETVVGQRLQEGFFMLDATATKQFWQRRIALTAGVKNLLDIRQVGVTGGGGGAHSGGSGNMPVGTGRNFFVRAALDLSWNGK